MTYVELKQDGNMKKYEIKGWAMVFLFLFTLLWMVSCRTVDKTTTNEQTKTESSVFEGISLDNQGAVSVSDFDAERQERLLRELVSSLQLGFNGQNENDKLIVELQRSIDGLKFQVSGTGTANYQEHETINLEEIINEHLKRQDSVFNQRLNSFYTEFKGHLNEHFKSEKEVKVKGFQVGFYAILIIALVTFLAGYFLSKTLSKYLP